ncbi:MAG TPA: Fic family protein [Desulfatiglandales bacterium]|nr:Fic family protein [Desulfatiglandales bacterium]
MKKGGRYDVSGLVEAQYEAGSNDMVLRNLLGIIDPDEMDRVEARALAKATDILIRKYDQEHQFTAADTCHFHKTWLGKVYEWAGRYRKTNITKDDFTFAMAAQIHKLMEQFEQSQLTQYTPCEFKNREEVVKALAEVHTELLLIHPFREGNGRVARLLSLLMALQAELPILDFSLISEHKKQEYIEAVHAGMDRNYQPMEALFSEIIEKSISA